MQPQPPPRPAERPPLLLLHGALGAGSQFKPLLPLLASHFQVHALDFEGHGQAPLSGRPFRVEHFAENVDYYLEANGLGTAHLFGYGLGGYVALYLARTQPGRVSSLATLATKFQWDPEIAVRAVRQLEAGEVTGKVPQIAQALASRHTAAGWEAVLDHTAGCLTALGRDPLLGPMDFASIRQPARLCVGDRDDTVGVAETLMVFQMLPRGELEVYPGTAHALEQVGWPRLAQSLLDRL